MNKIGIITDSTADIPAELVNQLGIQIIPTSFIIEGKEYQDGEGMTREEFYEKLSDFKTFPTTSAPSIAAFQEAYERLIHEGYTRICSVHLSSQLSSLYNNACLAAQEVASRYGARISVLDSRSVSLGLGFQVMAAAEAVKRGLDIEEIGHELETLSKKVRVAALLDTMEFTRRGGRVGWMTAALSNALGLKALIDVRDGIVGRLGMARTRRQAIQQIIHHLQILGPLKYLAVVYTSIKDQAEIEQILQAAPTVANPPFVVPVTTVVGAHTGPYTIGFAAIPA